MRNYSNHTSVKGLISSNPTVKKEEGDSLGWGWFVFACVEKRSPFYIFYCKEFRRTIRFR